MLRASQTQSRVEVEREGHAYPGVYVGFRQSFQNNGVLIGDLIIVWRAKGRLLFRQFDPVFSHSGEAMILRHQLFFVGEDGSRADGLGFYVLNGVLGRKAIRMDGLVMGVASDRFRTPTAAPVVLQRLMDLDASGEPPPDEALAPIMARLSASYASAEIVALAGAAIREALGYGAPIPSRAAPLDHLLRLSAEGSLAASEIEWNKALEADCRALRAALLGADDCFSVFDKGSEGFP